MTTLEILLLIALVIAIICDIIRIVFWVRFNSGRGKKNIKKYICTRVRSAETDWCNDCDNPRESLSEYIERTFDKYFD